jgi:hypothetical protein
MFFVSASLKLQRRGGMPSPILSNNMQQSTLERSSSSMEKSSMVATFRKWDSEMGCAAFREKYDIPTMKRTTFLQDPNSVACSELKQKHVTILVKRSTWLPDSMHGLYSCGCGLSCMWEKSSLLAYDPDVEMYETTHPSGNVSTQTSNNRCLCPVHSTSNATLKDPINEGCKGFTGVTSGNVYQN